VFRLDPAPSVGHDVAEEKPLREDPSRQTFRLRVLALVLALALTWYSANPAQGATVRRRRPTGDGPDEKRRPARPPAGGRAALPTAEEDISDELDWPEYVFSD
jgi:hypothetical protein